ncbi:hypothetical protein QS306_08135 [Paraburkholderia bonniea]|uniref:hypothetical protein n=1 Tax=Paraburkholderia bonniea TaxID=2152891 RepID=UPI001FE8F9F4|nr:hypothetical protein [Paraburkholderia bonniea]WJF89110.1 hypothetical protein QS306_08135 [Paraburkholderia bonniea]WJF92426.1 hypothetical protein QS308_08145 [Paraburkholderia bonniea]
MKSISSIKTKKKILFKRFTVGYISLLSLPLLILGFSLAQGAGWKPVLVGSPAFLTLLGAATYQFIKELRALKREEKAADKSPNGNG